MFLVNLANVFAEFSIFVVMAGPISKISLITGIIRFRSNCNSVEILYM